MTVYVDDMRREATVGGLHGHWSHMFADTHEQLMAAARRLGLRLEWLQHPGTHREHFDLIEPRRRLAVQMGAVEITYPHETGALIARKRSALANPNPEETP